MSPAKVGGPPPPRVVSLTTRLASQIGEEIHDARLRRGWRLQDLASKAAVAVSTVHGIEAGRVAALETYLRLAAVLGLSPRFTMLPERAARAQRDADPVHAAMGEVLAGHFRRLGFEVLLDEPYQHYQFAGRADVVAVDRQARALLHVEDRTRFPDIQAFIGTFNSKKAYLAADLADRLAISGGFRSQDHVVAALWSSEVLHAMRLREQSFRAVCPDSPDAFAAWWGGHPLSTSKTTSSIIVFDPLPGERGSRRRWVGLDAIRTVDRRYLGYADALEAMRRSSLA